MSRIKLLRQARGWRQADLAERAGLHADSVGRIELGRRPHRSTAKRLADALGVPPEILDERKL